MLLQKVLDWKNNCWKFSLSWLCIPILSKRKCAANWPPFTKTTPSRKIRYALLQVYTNSFLINVPWCTKCFMQLTYYNIILTLQKSLKMTSMTPLTFLQVLVKRARILLFAINSWICNFFLLQFNQASVRKEKDNHGSSSENIKYIFQQN